MVKLSWFSRAFRFFGEHLSRLPKPGTRATIFTLLGTTLYLKGGPAAVINQVPTQELIGGMGCVLGYFALELLERIDRPQRRKVVVSMRRPIRRNVEKVSNASGTLSQTVDNLSPL